MDINSAAEIGRLLKKKKKTLAIAESCTGGLLSSRVTSVPGSSDYFVGGIVAYQNRVKSSQLRVPPGILSKYGAVSAQTAEALAKNVRKILRSDYALSVTGIAGPSGGSQKKPLGLVYIALSGANKVKAKKFLFSGNRNSIRNLVVRNALDLLKKELLSTPHS